MQEEFMDSCWEIAAFSEQIGFSFFCGFLSEYGNILTIWILDIIKLAFYVTQKREWFPY